MGGAFKGNITLAVEFFKQVIDDEIGQFCCKIQDQYGSSQTLCANLGKYIFKQLLYSYNS